MERRRRIVTARAAARRGNARAPVLRTSFHLPAAANATGAAAQ